MHPSRIGMTLGVDSTMLDDDTVPISYQEGTEPMAKLNHLSGKIQRVNHLNRTDSQMMRVWHVRLAKGEARFYAEHPNYPRLINA